MRKFGLIGYPLGHSFSKGYFTEKFKKEKISGCDYQNYPIKEIDQFRQLIDANPELAGINVTIPYKEQIIKYLDNLDEVAENIGAVNTIKISRINENVNLTGFNTDYYGFEESLKPLVKPIHKKSLILGTGGASKAVSYVLKKLGIPYKFVSRNPSNNEMLSYEELTADIINDYLIIVNTSPLGMYPNIQSCPDIPYKELTKNHILYELIYNPEQTLFMNKGAQQGASTINGLSMLHLQAEKAWEIWNS